MPIANQTRKRGILRRVAGRITLWRLRLTNASAEFIKTPEPRTIGSFQIGQMLCESTYRTTGYQSKIRNNDLWSLRRQSSDVNAELHSFLWLDDLAAVGDLRSRQCAELWLSKWIAKYGKGRGVGWAPDITGRRLARWINHSDFLLGTTSEKFKKNFSKSLRVQLLYLARAWRSTKLGLPRLEAATGVVCSSLALKSFEHLVEPTLSGFVLALEQTLDHDGAIRSRNPEDLLQILTLCSWIIRDLEDAKRPVPDAISQHAQKIASQLRGLRHGDGSLARFHGASRGQQGLLDAALLLANAKTEPPREDPMGYSRFVSGSTTLIVDTSAPDTGKNAILAHASTNAFELYSGRVPIISNAGTGFRFGPDDFEASREAAAHSNLVLAGQSFGEFGKNRTGQSVLLRGPNDTPIRRNRAIDGARLQCAHDGYVKGFGLRHARTLDLTTDGKGLRGEDLLAAQSKSEIKTLKKALLMNGGAVQATVRFHLHPDIVAKLQRRKGTVSLDLSNGTTWMFSHDGSGTLSIEQSVYFQQGLPVPRDSKQIVLSFSVQKPVSKVTWSLVKSEQTA